VFENTVLRGVGLFALTDVEKRRIGKTTQWRVTIFRCD